MNPGRTQFCFFARLEIIKVLDSGLVLSIFLQALKIGLVVVVRDLIGRDLVDIDRRRVYNVESEHSHALVPFVAPAFFCVLISLHEIPNLVLAVPHFNNVQEGSFGEGGFLDEIRIRSLIAAGPKHDFLDVRFPFA